MKVHGIKYLDYEIRGKSNEKKIAQNLNLKFGKAF